MYIEVVSTPPGHAPEWVRDAMIGIQIKSAHDQTVTMPTINSANAPKTRLGQWLYILQGKAEMRTGYVVHANELLGLLLIKSQAAAEWCLENTPHMAKEGQMFMLDQSCCRKVYAH